MPLPPNDFTLTGGCNCLAIRYRIAVSPVTSRPLHPNSSATDPVHLPFIATDHCNDCRRASGSILPTWLCTPLDTVTVSLVQRQPPPPTGDATTDTANPAAPIHIPTLGPFPAEPAKPQDPDFQAPVAATAAASSTNTTARTPYRPGSEIFTSPTSPTSTESSFLTFYESTPGKRRFFCSRCGTNLAYVPVANYLPGFPAMCDLVLGSLDRRCLEMEGVRPERQLWWDWGVGWVKGLSLDGLRIGKGEGEGVPRHGDYDVGVRIGEGGKVGGPCSERK